MQKIQVAGERRDEAMRCRSSARRNAGNVCLAPLAAMIVALVALLACVVPQALAAGDANMASCPASTESSVGFRTSLPDCRAYELVTQANSGDLLNVGEERYGFADHFMYKSTLPTPGEATRAGLPEEFLATRTAQGWQQTALTVPQGEGAGGELVFDTGGVMFTGDFADALLMAPWQDPLESPRMDETTGRMVYELSLSSGTTSTVSLPDSGKLTQSMIEFPAAYKGEQAFNNGWGSFLDGASQDGSRVFFSTSARLATAPGTPEDTHQTSGEVYERTGGHTYLVGVLPDGEVPVCGAEVGQSDRSTAGHDSNDFYSYGAIAPDGSTVVFHTPGKEPVGTQCTERETGVFLRDVVNGTTVKLPGEFYAGRAGTQPGEEEKIFTVEPVGSPSGGKLFEYHVNTKQTVELASESEGLLAYSANGARVYYLGPEKGIYIYEEGVAAPTLVPGTQQGGYGFGGGSGLVGSHISSHEPTISTFAADENAPVATSSGNYLMFLSPNELTPYKNCVESKGEEHCHVEVYLYDAGADSVTCVSCGPVTAAPQGNASFALARTGPHESADWMPSAPPLIDSRPAEGGGEAVMRVVFQTTEGLVPQDTNGTWDVYEWTQEETEGCSRAGLKLASLTESPDYSEADHGCLYLLSPGTGRELDDYGDLERKEGGSHLLGASEGLTDIYIETVEPLTGTADLDNVAHVYDVRQDGGFPVIPTATNGCEPGLCRSEGEGSPVFGEPASVAFTGAGNLKPATVKPKPKPKTSLTRNQKLARALKVCKRRTSKRRQAACERKARRKYSVKPSHGHGGASK